jgi:hypothetical protein
MRPSRTLREVYALQETSEKYAPFKNPQRIMRPSRTLREVCALQEPSEKHAPFKNPQRGMRPSRTLREVCALQELSEKYAPFKNPQRSTRQQKIRPITVSHGIDAYTHDIGSWMVSLCVYKNTYQNILFMTASFWNIFLNPWLLTR